MSTDDTDGEDSVGFVGGRYFRASLQDKNQPGYQNLLTLFQSINSLQKHYYMRPIAIRGVLPSGGNTLTCPREYIYFLSAAIQLTSSEVACSNTRRRSNSNDHTHLASGKGSPYTFRYQHGDQLNSPFSLNGDEVGI